MSNKHLWVRSRGYWRLVTKVDQTTLNARPYEVGKIQFNSVKNQYVWNSSIFVRNFEEETMEVVAKKLIELNNELK